MHFLILDISDLNYSDEMIRWDILDQLWRFNTSGWGNGIRDYDLTIRPNSTRATSLNPEISQMEIEANKEKWRNFFDDNVYGGLFSWLEDVIDLKDPLYILPLTVSEMGIHSFLWEHSKFYGEGGNPSGNGLSQAVPTSYLVVYWMGRAYNIF